MRHAVRAATVSALLVSAASGFAGAHVPHVSAIRDGTLRAPRSVWDSVFTAAQATRGEAVYRSNCLRCHQESLVGTVDNPPLAGPVFLGNWNNMSVWELHDRVLTTMPADSAGILNKQQASDVLAYVFSVNGFPAGRAELLAEPDSLKDIKIGPRAP